MSGDIYCQLNNSKVWFFKSGLARGCVNLSSTDCRVAKMTHPMTDGWCPGEKFRRTTASDRNIFVSPDIEHTSE